MRRTHLALLALVLLAGTLPTTARAAELCPGAPQGHTATDATVTSFDGTQIAITEFRPADACADHPVPVVLTLHGWSGSRARTVGQVADLLHRRYAVVSIDSRGNGESGGASLVHHPSQEVRDFQKVLDHIYDTMDYVQKEGAPELKDVRVGARSGSYGGGFQLMLAAFDDRLDAMQPSDTWHDLPQSLAPNGALKLFVSLLYASGKQGKRLDERLDRWFAEGMATNELPAEARQNFLESSPKTYADRLDVPAFFTQGMIDTLFNLNEAVGNFRAVRANGAPAWLVGRNAGHVYPGLQPTGIDAPPRPASGCDAAYEGGLDEARYDFFAAFLKGDAEARARLDALPPVVLATEDGGCVTSAAWPPPASQHRRVSSMVLVPAAGSQLLPLLTATEPTTIAGIPRATLLMLADVDDRLYLSLAVRRGSRIWVVDDQVTGFRTPASAVTLEQYDIELGGVATTLQPGDELMLRVDGLNEQYMLNGNRKPGIAAITSLSVSVPII